jgi:[FeFe] hydrogenase H-cluster radical SAM maturase HydE
MRAMVRQGRDGASAFRWLCSGAFHHPAHSKNSTNSTVEETTAAAVLSRFLFQGSVKIEPGDVVEMSVPQMESLLLATSSLGKRPELQHALFTHAESVTRRFFGNGVYYRGIIEFSNVCDNDCYYCGIRKHQPRTWRYTMPKEEIVSVVRWAYDNDIRTVMLQSGELNTPERNVYIQDVVKSIRQQFSPEEMCIALSVGELSLPQYRALRESGAERYLLRIETSNPELFASLHPPSQTWAARVQALRDLKEAGFQLGTGVMVGLSGQTLLDLAQDLKFFKEMGADMIGMGPYITEPGTPTAQAAENQGTFSNDKGAHMKEMVLLTMRMNAIARITLSNVNIAATTALQAIDPRGREVALQRGANVMMPILTPTKYRQHYTLYEGKPCISDTAIQCQRCLTLRLAGVGKSFRAGQRGDPPSFRNRFFTSQIDYNTAFCRRSVSTESQVERKLESNHSDVPRVNIGIFGRMNAGKSTCMNRIVASDVSIVDSTPGTTADTKIATMELHAAGPVKLFDTAGIDEKGILGEKKRWKVLSTLKECDIAIIVISLKRMLLPPHILDLEWEKVLIDRALTAGAVPLILFNQDVDSDDVDREKGANVMQAVREELRNLPGAVFADQALKDPLTSQRLSGLLEKIVIEHVKGKDLVACLPKQFLNEEAMIFLNIPMDEETPGGRLLRPQAMVQEEAIRRFATTVAYRMNLANARSSDPVVVQVEKERFLRSLGPVIQHAATGRPALIVTDSQAVDIVHPWTLEVDTGKPLVPFTTFSIAMIQRQLGGKREKEGHFKKFAIQGIEAAQRLERGGRVLIAEACNHNRITQQCNDIGMVQIPRALHLVSGLSATTSNELEIEHAFGREFPQDVARDEEVDKNKPPPYSLAVMCGGCMVQHQKIRARVSDLQEAGVPVTNYGLLLSFAHSPDAMRRALEPWGISV